MRLSLRHDNTQNFLLSLSQECTSTRTKPPHWQSRLKKNPHYSVVMDWCLQSLVRGFFTLYETEKTSRTISSVVSSFWSRFDPVFPSRLRTSLYRTSPILTKSLSSTFSNLRTFSIHTTLFLLTTPSRSLFLSFIFFVVYSYRSTLGLRCSVIDTLNGVWSQGMKRPDSTPTLR